jgi:Tol biopolymer transport system component
MNGMNASTHFQRTLPRRSSILLLMVTVGVAILATGLLILVVASMPVLAALPVGNGSIAFTSQRDGDEEVYAMNADGTDQTRLTHNASTASTDATAGRDLLPSFLPDGGRVAFTSRRPVENIHPDGGIDEVYLVDAQDRDGVPGGDNLTRLTGDVEGMQHNFGAVFSANGTKVVFVGAWNGTGTNEIYVTGFADADGTNPARLTGPVRQLTNNALIERFPAISPDSAKIAFSRRDGTDDIWMMNADGTGQTNLTNTPGNDLYPNFSPDGTKIVFSSNRRAPDNTTDSEIYVMNADGSNLKALTTNSVTDESPVFSPDGTKIAFTSTRNGNTTVEANNKEIWVMNADGSSPVRLTKNSVEDSDPDWGPDTTAPKIECGAADGDWHKEDVSIACTASDDGVGLADPTTDAGFTLTTSVPVETETANAQTDSRQVCDAAGNCATAGPVGGNKVDKKAPEISISVSPSGDEYELGDDVTVSYDCTDGGSGTASCSGPADSGGKLVTSSVGQHIFTVESADEVGNAGSKSILYQVIYDFSGFYSPVDNPDMATNKAKAGSSIPVKFSLGGDQGLDIFATGTDANNNTFTYPTSTAMTCDSTADLDTIEETVTAGGGSLQYDASLDQYTYVWKTNKAWAGTCRQLVVKLDDGTYHRANFEFVK